MPQASDKSVSVIDDEETIRLSVVSLIRSVGYKSKAYLSADAFLNSDDLGKQDCIITDICMPGRTGLDLIKDLRARGYSTPVILITAKHDERLLDKARESGAVCLLQKPFDAQNLIDCVNQAIMH